MACFNPRTRVGCDYYTMKSFESLYTFQSTHPRGVRRELWQACEVALLVSIHAPAWGATRPTCRGSRRWSLFQSTHPRGVRLLPQIGADAIIRFQSTHPRGVRRRALPCWPASTRFQSTHPRGVRRRALPCWPASTRFQSTHPRGVRHASLERVPHEALVSIHAPAWGATGA